MTTDTTPTDAEINRALVKRLVTACDAAGLTTVVTDPTRVVRVNTPHGREQMAEEITLGTDHDGFLRWHWSWGQPIAIAADVTKTVDALTRVLLSPIP